MQVRPAPRGARLDTDMFSRAALALLAVVVAEYLLFGFAADLLGTSTVVWLSVGAAVAGVLLVRRFVPAVLKGGLQLPVNPAQSSPVEPPSTGPGRTVAGHALLVVAGLLLIVPGLLTGLVGTLLVLPPVRSAVRAGARHRIDSLVSRGLGAPEGLRVSFAGGGRPFARRDIVDIDLHPDDKTRGGTAAEDSPKSAPPELN